MSTERASSGPLPIGTVVGGRFEVQSDRLTDRLGVILQCRDQKTEKPIALRLLRPGLMDGAGMKILRAECRTAARLSHPAIITTYGVGSAGGHTFVATGWLQGEPLPTRIAARPVDAPPISLGSAFTIVSELCRALTAAQPKTSHGALRPSAVWIGDDGAVQLTGFGVDRTLLATRSASVFAPDEQACFAPEVKAGSPPTAAADIFGIGAILYMLLTGKSPGDGFVPPSQVHPQATPDLDRLLLMCLAADPAQRFASPDEIRSALLPLVSHDTAKSLTEDFGITAAPPAPEAPSDELGLDIDVDLGSGFPVAGDNISPPVVPPAGNVPQVGARVSIHEQFRPSLPQAQAAPAQAAQGTDLGQLLKKVAENDSHRWMVDKDGLSHGPFDGRELVELILKGEVVEDHVLLNMDTGEKKPIQEWPDFREFVSDYKLRKRQSDRKTALADAERTQKRSGTTKLFLGGIVLVGLVGSIVTFVVTRDSEESAEVADSELGELFAHGEIELEGTAGILPDPPRRHGMGMGRTRGMGGGGGGGFAGSYEDAMNRAVELGDITMNGGQGRLSPAQVSGVLNRHVNRIYQRCVVAEASRGGRLGNVTIDVAIAGSGAVLGVSARQGSGAFKSCVRGAVRRVRFPSFGAPRMGARYSFDASP